MIPSGSRFDVPSTCTVRVSLLYEPDRNSSAVFPAHGYDGDATTFQRLLPLTPLSLNSSFNFAEYSHPGDSGLTQIASQTPSICHLSKQMKREQAKAGMQFQPKKHTPYWTVWKEFCDDGIKGMLYMRQLPNHRLHRKSERISFFDSCDPLRDGSTPCRSCRQWPGHHRVKSSNSS